MASLQAEMLDKLSNHPNVVSFVGAVTKVDATIQGTSHSFSITVSWTNKSYRSFQGIDAHPFALVLEYYHHGSLFDLLVARKAELPLHVIVRMARDISLGILHLHKEQVHALSECTMQVTPPQSRSAFSTGHTPRHCSPKCTGGRELLYVYLPLLTACLEALLTALAGLTLAPTWEKPCI